jgi:formylglycine-generating enzyme required for sulfatase activity
LLYIKESGAMLRHPDHILTSMKSCLNHPVSGVSALDADNFCRWLTMTETNKGSVSTSHIYRLPYDNEWSSATGKLDDANSDVFDWGNEWPPPINAANLSRRLGIDQYDFTAPVGMFPANTNGLFDMTGNVAEWCQIKGTNKTINYIIRGSSYCEYKKEVIRLGFRNSYPPDSRYSSMGFRCILSKVE